MESPFSKVHTLVVDDVTSARRVVTKILSELGFRNLVEAKSGKEAIEKLSRESFQLVISDQDMPEMNGLELVRNMRANTTLKDIPVIMVTSASAKDSVVEAIQAGVSDYVVKPVSVDTLLNKIRRVFADLAQKSSTGS